MDDHGVDVGRRRRGRLAAPSPGRVHWRPCHHVPEIPSSSTSPRSPTAGRASRGWTTSSSSCAAPCPATACCARVTRRRQHARRGRTLEVLSPSPRRVAPRCRHSQECGGCEWQTLDYAAQLEFKQQQVVDSLQRIAHLTDYELEPIRGMDDPWRYRNKMEFSFGEDERGRPRPGPAQARVVEGDRRRRRLHAGLGAHERGAERPSPTPAATSASAVLARRARRPAAPPGRARGHGRAATCCSTCSSRRASPRRPSSSRRVREAAPAARRSRSPSTSTLGRRRRRRPAHAAGPAAPARAPRRRGPARAGHRLPADQQRDVRGALRDGAAVRRAGGRTGRLWTCTAASAR